MKKMSDLIDNIHGLVKAKSLTTSTVENVVKKSRTMVSHFKHSKQVCRHLADCQQLCDVPAHKLIQDVETRWNSTFLILHGFFRLPHHAETSQRPYNHDGFKMSWGPEYNLNVTLKIAMKIAINRQKVNFIIIINYIIINYYSVRVFAYSIVYHLCMHHL